MRPALLMDRTVTVAITGVACFLSILASATPGWEKWITLTLGFLASLYAITHEPPEDL